MVGIIVPKQVEPQIQQMFEFELDVQMLLDAGASMTGKTHMDELAYSLNGENVHYGTPANPAAPGRIPGGSSSGSAVSQ